MIFHANTDTSSWPIVITIQLLIVIVYLQVANSIVPLTIDSSLHANICQYTNFIIVPEFEVLCRGCDEQHDFCLQPHDSIKALVYYSVLRVYCILA